MGGDSSARTVGDRTTLFVGFGSAQPTGQPGIRSLSGAEVIWIPTG
jgi:hypothetical protein